MFDRNGASVHVSGEVQLDMPYIRSSCSEDRKCVARLFTLFVLLKEASDLFDQVDVNTVLDRPHDVLRSIENLRRLAQQRL